MRLYLIRFRGCAAVLDAASAIGLPWGPTGVCPGVGGQYELGG